ncbi:DUF1996 domain-containing protein [Kineosporia succinea]|uniref:DUF1996 domain-containing protein n=1 Tax=Kineosporia succinea TaxID=84632 RepID=A0ABT9PBA0_9ACTN|nr:DUF1996 domain-containing protein [Kineosporia succinea]MDP9829976.1 hypothetical protein [Kineosporia succinea]
MKRRYTVAGGVVGATLVGVLVAVSSGVPAFSSERTSAGHHGPRHSATATHSAAPETAETSHPTHTPGDSTDTTGSTDTTDTVDPKAPTSTVSDPADHDMPGMVKAPAYNPNLDPGESDTVSPAVKGIAPEHAFNPGPSVSTHHEFQANCYMSHHEADDPIVYPGMAGASHMHTFMGSDDTNAKSTTASLKAGGTSCITPGDRSGYWHPSIYNGDQLVTTQYKQTIYYKSGVSDYRTVRAFPQGLRYVVGSPTQTKEEFENHPGTVEGWECGDSANNFEIPDHCREGSYLNIRMQAPSCWDGVHLDSADHKSHMAYPVVEDNRRVCPSTHPVAVPMVEFKMAFNVSGDMSKVRLSSGTDWSWHYDFFNGWDAPTLAALVEHCINGGLQCDPRGFDLYKPDRGAALNEKYELAG